MGVKNKRGPLALLLALPQSGGGLGPSQVSIGGE